MNTEKQAFTCIGRGHGAPVRPAGREEWERMRREPFLSTQCAKIERLEAEGAPDDIIKGEKAKLWVWTPHCAEFRGGHRSIADAVKPLPRLMLDFDEKGHTIDIIKSLTPDPSPKGEGSEMKAGPLTVLLIEESVRRGTHVLVELPEGMTADEAQQLMAKATGFEPDKAVKDVSRCIYMVPEDHTRYVSERLWEGSNHLQDVHDEESAKVTAPSLTGRAGGESGSLESGSALSYRGILYSDIIRAYWAATGGEPVEGERNVKLHKLAANLRAICDNKKEVLMQVMPRYGLSEQELRSIVDSACKEPPREISRVMKGIIKGLSPDRPTPDPSRNGGELAGAEGDFDEDEKLATLNPQITTKKLPIGLKESLVGVPEAMRMPVLCAVLPIAAAYADQVEVEYCDGARQHLGLMSIIRGEQASGKSVCKSAVDVWKRQFDEEDALARKREEEWKERKKGRKANEKAPDDPHVMIRTVPITVSCSTLLKRLKNAHDHTLYSFCEELDTLRKTNGAGSWSSKYDIYRLAFDRGEWGQDYNSDQAESGVVSVAYNWSILGTNGAMRKCFKGDNIENGLSSRILVSEMPDSTFAKMPKYGRRSEDDEARIQEAVTKLRSYSGFIDTPRLRRAIEQWVEEKRVEAAKDIDRVKDTYRKRAAVIAFRCGVIHHLLEGAPDREGAATIKFALMMADYTLEQQIRAFGETLESQYVEARDNCQRYGSNHSIFDQLPPTFTMDDLRALKKGWCGESALRNITSRWHRDGWIERADRTHWQKCHNATLPHCPIKEEE